MARTKQSVIDRRRSPRDISSDSKESEVEEGVSKKARGCGDESEAEDVGEKKSGPSDKELRERYEKKKKYD